MYIPAGPLVTVGDLVWDVVLQTDTALLRGGDTTGSITLAPGGSAANVAVWWARVGSTAQFVGSVGSDVFGDIIIQDLHREQVTGAVRQLAGTSTGVIVSIVEHDGQRSMVTNQGADFLLQPEHVPLDIIQQASLVHVTGWSLFADPPRAAALHAIHCAQQHGVLVSLDPASFQMIQNDRRVIDVLQQVHADIVLPNRDEGRALTGEQHPADVTRSLRQQWGCGMVVLKLDQDGCFVDDGVHTKHYPSRQVVAVDSTGAGDAFNAVFLAEFQRTGDIDRAATMANTLASWVVTKVGARPAVDADWHTLAQKNPSSL